MPIITIIGLDGSGKTTQAKLLVQKLNASGIKASYVRPDYVLIELLSSIKLPVDRFLPSPRQERTGVRSDSTQKKKKRRLLSFMMGITGYLYAWVNYFIVDFYSRGRRVVVGDRYFYQFFYDIYGSNSRKVIKLFPKPDIVYFLDGNLELCRSRMTNPFDKAVSNDYYSKVRSLLLELAPKYGFVTIDASQDVDSISNFIFTHCSTKLRGLKRGKI